MVRAIPSNEIRRLPLHKKHVESGAKLGSFGDWEVPLYYTSILEEHEAVRKRAGLFDISHMGEFYVRGKGAAHFLQEVLPRDIQKMAHGLLPWAIFSGRPFKADASHRVNHYSEKLVD